MSTKRPPFFLLYGPLLIEIAVITLVMGGGALYGFAMHSEPKATQAPTIIQIPFPVQPTVCNASAFYFDCISEVMPLDQCIEADELMAQCLDATEALYGARP